MNCPPEPVRIVYCGQEYWGWYEIDVNSQTLTVHYSGVRASERIGSFSSAGLKMYAKLLLGDLVQLCLTQGIEGADD